MFLELDGRPKRGGRLRLWTDPDGPVDGLHAGTSIEWAGRVGHPSSYVLLGGRLAVSPVDIVPPTWSGRFEDSLAGEGDVVEFGLPPEYAEVVAAEWGGRIQITVAGHGLEGSSQSSFRQAARFLELLLRKGVPTEADQLWAAWEHCS